MTEGAGDVAKCLPSIRTALGSMPRAGKKKIKVVDEFSGEISSGSMHGINGDQNRVSSSSVVDPTHT